MVGTTSGDEIATLTYEQARDELVSIVARLEGGRVGLEESMTLWERGEALASHCSAWLEGAQARLEGNSPAVSAPPTAPDSD